MTHLSLASRSGTAQRERYAWNFGIVFLIMLCSQTSLAAVCWSGQHQNHRHEQADRDRDRWMWQLPGRVLDTLGLKGGMNVADVGAGEGYFTWRIAERVGKEGKVYANEIEKRLVDRIAHESKDRGLTNVVPVQGTPDDPKLPSNAVDVVLMVNVAHFLEEPEAFYRKLKTSLREGGKLAIVQWDATKMNIEHEMDGSEKEKYSEESVVAPVEAAGYEIVAKETFLPVQNLYICQPK